METTSSPLLVRLSRLEIPHLVIRWALILIAFLWLIPEGEPRPKAFYAWWALVVVNCSFLTFLFLRHRFTIYMYYLSPLADLMLITGAVYAAESRGYMLAPLYFLPINEAALKFGWRGGLLSGGLAAALGGLTVIPAIAPASVTHSLWGVIFAAALVAIVVSTLIAERELAAYGEDLVIEPIRHEGIEKDVLLEVVGQASARLSPTDSFRCVLDIIKDFFKADACLLYEVTDQGGRLEVAASADSDLELLRRWQGLYAGKAGDCQAQRTGQGLLGEDQRRHLSCPAFRPWNAPWHRWLKSKPRLELPCTQLIRARSAHSFMCAPVVAKGSTEPIGVLHCLGLRPYAFTKDDLVLLGEVAQQLAPAWERAKAESFDRGKYTEPGTAMYNRAYFLRRIEEEIARARRYGRSLSVVLVRADAVPERAGAAGDPASEALIAETITRRVRRVDAVCRLGFGEVAVILPEAGREQAWRVAERIHREMDKSVPADQSSGGISPTAIRVGVASLSPDDHDGIDLWKRAELSLLGPRGRHEERPSRLTSGRA
jgi:diguanylate cyclase (GGDEF)-like protein